MTKHSPLAEADFEAVRRIPLFGGLEAETVRRFAAEARTVDYDSRTLILSRGDVADRFFVVLAGRVRLFVLNVEGRESVIEFIEPGQSFAEAAMFGTCRVPVNAEAEAGTRLVHLPARPVLALIDSASLRIEGYFEETKLASIHIGQSAQVRLMGDGRVITGHVTSIAPAIEDHDRIGSTNLLPAINPSFSWVRLAQRVPVRIAIDHAPRGIALIAGRTATVTLARPAEPRR